MAKAKRPPQTARKLGGPRLDGGPREAKVKAVADLAERLGGSNAVLLTEYRGLTVHELAELRAALREAGTEYKVYKNRLATIAARTLGLEDLLPYFKGPTAFAFAGGDPVLAAKRLAAFARKAPALVFKAGLLEGRVLGPDEVSRLSALESREVMLGRLAGMMMSPIQQLANVLAAQLHQIGALFVQLRDKLPPEGSGAPGPPDEPDPPAPAAAEAGETEPQTDARIPTEPGAPAEPDAPERPTDETQQEG